MRGAGRPRLNGKRLALLLGTVVAITAIVVALAVVIRTPPSQSRVLDAAATVDQVSKLSDGNGLIAAPPMLGAGALDSSAWATLFLKTIGVPALTVDAESARALGARESDPLWAAFFETSLGLRRLDKSAVTQEIEGLVGTPSSGESEVANTALRMWAGVSSLPRGALDESTRNGIEHWLSAQLAQCRMNAFVGYYAQATRVRLNPTLSSEWPRLFTRCGYGSMPSTATAPTNEVELLSAFAASQWRARQSTSTRVTGELDLLRSMLRPDASMAFDPWWAFYAASGYIAAGGDSSDYKYVADIMRSHVDAHGLVPESTLPQTDIRTTFDAVSLLTDLGHGVPATLNSANLSDPNKLAGDHPWSDAEWAAWGTILYDIRIQIPASERTVLQKHVAACLSQQVDPSTARQVGICRTAAEHYGWSNSVSIDWSRWPDVPAEALVNAVASLGLSPSPARTRTAIATVVDHASSMPTSVLANAALAAKAARINMSNTQKTVILGALRNRGAAAPFAGLLKESREGASPSLEATARVATVERWNLLAHS